MFGAMVPILRSFDETKAKEFYVDFMGFTVDWEHRFADNAPLYMQVSKDGIVLHVSEHHGDCSPGGAVRIETRDVDAFSKTLRDKRYKYANPGCGEVTPWGTKEVSLSDPFKNRLIFWQPAEMTSRAGGERKRYMVIEHFRDPVAVYRRFHDRGRLAPDGLRYISSWVTPGVDRCFQMMETDDETLLKQWLSEWEDLVEFEVIPVVSSDEAAAAIAPRLGK